LSERFTFHVAFWSSNFKMSGIRQSIAALHKTSFCNQIARYDNYEQNGSKNQCLRLPLFRNLPVFNAFQLSTDFSLPNCLLLDLQSLREIFICRWIPAQEIHKMWWLLWPRSRLFFGSEIYISTYHKCSCRPLSLFMICILDGWWDGWWHV
jgi:hypothetical protein